MAEKNNRTKSSWYLSDEVLQAMNLVKQKEGINISNQVELGALMYLQKHKKLLDEHGLNLWK